MWTILRHVSKGKYIYAVVPEHPKANKYGYVLEHRVVVENCIGRLLLDTEEVHHIDGNRRNNDPGNLEIISRGEHQAAHMRSRYPLGRARVRLICAYCGVEFWRFANQTAYSKGQRNNFCSRKCSGKYNGFGRV